MINKIVDTVKQMATEHKLIRSFVYDELNKLAGIGEQIYPLVFLEMPIYYSKAAVTDGLIPVTFNIDIVLNPQALRNWPIKQLTPLSCQEIASQIGLQFVARLRNLFKEQKSEIDVTAYSILTLQRWYDDKSYGVRLTINADVMSDIALCSDDDYFDPDKELTEKDLLNNIDTEDAQGCTSLSYKLPKIQLD